MRGSLVSIISMLLAGIVFAFPVKFTYEDPNAKQVYLAGDFNDWNQTSTPLEKKSERLWEITLDLPAGKYEYKFIVDGAWMNDPKNPVKVGSYGNSAIEVGDDGTVSVPIGGNFLGNTAISFRGDFQFYLPYSPDSTNRWRIARPIIDFRPRLIADLGRGGRLDVKFLFSTKEEDNYHNIFMRIRDVAYSFNRGALSFLGFYDKRVIRFDEPFGLLGYTGEFQDQFGWDEAGAMVKVSPTKDFECNAVFSDNINNDRDLYALRLRWRFVGLSYTTENFLEKEYSTPAPFSSSNDTLYNASRSQFCISTDLKFPWGIYLGILHSEKNFVASESNYGTGNWQKVRRSWFLQKKDWICLGIEERNLPLSFKGSLRLDTEGAQIKDPYTHGWFFRSNKHSLSFTGISLELEHSSKVEDSQFALNYTLFDYGDTSLTRWSDIFYLDIYGNLTYTQYLLVGYEKNLTLEHQTEFHIFRPLILIWRNSLGTIDFGIKPKFIISEIQSSYSFGPFSFGFDLAGTNINDEYLGIHKSYLFKHIYLSYKFSDVANVRLGWGLDPYDLERERRNWREYLIEKGVSEEIVQNNFMQLKRILPEANRSLENYKQIYLKGEVIF